MEGFEQVAQEYGSQAMGVHRVGGVEELDHAIVQLHDAISSLSDDLQVVLMPVPSEDPKLMVTDDVSSPFRARAERVRDATERVMVLRRQLDL